MPSNNMDIATRIRNLRGPRTQVAFAELLMAVKVPRHALPHKICQTMISRYERGLELPSP